MSALRGNQSGGIRTFRDEDFSCRVKTKRKRSKGEKIILDFIKVVCIDEEAVLMINKFPRWEVEKKMALYLSEPP